MLVGKYYHHLETNQRVSLPKKWRSASKTWIITRGLDGCLFIFKPENFEQEISQIATGSLTSQTNRDLTRILTNEAEEIEPDRTGRIRIPSYLIEFAELKHDLVIVGSYNHLEIWNLDKYHQYFQKIETQAEKIAEEISNKSINRSS